MHALIVRNNSNPQAIDASKLLTAYFAGEGAGSHLFDATELGGEAARTWADEWAARTDLAVVLGGDGTILRTARLLVGEQVPMLGINFGHLGFLANACEDGVVAMVARALAGELVCERRANLLIDVVCEGDPDPFDDAAEEGGAAGDAVRVGRDKPDDARMSSDAQARRMPAFGVNTAGLHGARTFFALNEIAVTRGTLGRIIDFSLDIADQHIADMRGDGMVVATATGSTAYALSAGGPLVAPSFGGLVTVPLSPHTLRARAVLTGENDVVCVTLAGDDAGREAALFADGDLLVFDRPVRRVYVRRGPVPTLLLRTRDSGFYEYAAKTFF